MNDVFPLQVYRFRDFATKIGAEQATWRGSREGQRSARQRSRHIAIRYFWIADHLKSHGITVRYCNTAVMLADYLSKPLQGRSFRLFRAVLLGHKHVSTLSELLPRASDEERVL